MIKIEDKKRHRREKFREREKRTYYNMAEIMVVEMIESSVKYSAMKNLIQEIIEKITMIEICWLSCHS